MKQFKVSLMMIVILVIAFVTVKQESYIEIRHEDQLVLTLKVDLNDEFVYSSIHSVSLTEIIETIVIGDDEFIAMKVQYSDQGGAGMPEFDYGDSEFYIEDGYFVIDNMNRVFETLSFQVEPKYKNNMTINGRNIQLFDLIEDRKGSLEFEVITTSTLVYLIKQVSLK